MANTVTKPLALDETLQDLVTAVQNFTPEKSATVTNDQTKIPLNSAVYNYTRPVVVTADDTTPPSDTRAVWVYPS